MVENACCLCVLPCRFMTISVSWDIRLLSMPVEEGAGSTRHVPSGTEPSLTGRGKRGAGTLSRPF